MSEVLIGLASCHEAFVAAPVVRALQAISTSFRVALLGEEAAGVHASKLGLPQCELTSSGPRTGLAGAAAFASESLGDARLVLIFGTGRFAIALADSARQSGALSVRVDAGQRTGDAGDRQRRTADHLADRCCVRSDVERDHLIAEGYDEDSVTVIGSLCADALAALPPAKPSDAPSVWLALEHTRDPALEEHVHETSAHLDVAVEVARPDDDPAVHLARSRSAAAIITDSCGYQEFAAAAGVPAVVMAPAGARWDLVRSGAVRVAEHPDDLPQVLADALASERPKVEHAPAAELVVEALRGWLQPASDEGVEASEQAPLPTEANSSGRTFDHAELRAVQAVLRAGTLNSTKGTFVHRFEREFAEWLGVKHAIACANGSAAVHCALAALKLSAGDEVVTTPITDMGALTPIWYEGAVPVFADVDPDTLNVTAATIESQLTDRTRAVIVTHLFGRPCDMAPIVALCEARGLALIEDAAQAFGATLGEQAAGTIGQIAAFSLQQGKHITTGEGGVVCTDDDDLARQVFLYVNKAFGYGDEKPDHYFPALNYRMTELQGAVAGAQLPKLDEIVARRRMVAQSLSDLLGGLDGIRCPSDPPDGRHAYWKWSFLVDDQVVCGGAVELGARMRALGVACAPRYVQKPAFECQVFTDWRAHPVSSLPLQHNPRGAADGPLYSRADYPGAVRGLEQVVVLPINERYRPHHVAQVADAIRAAHKELTRA